MLIRPRELTERVADDRHRHIAALLSAGLRRRLRHSHACQRLERAPNPSRPEMIEAAP
jgi:hypothetical protein